MTLNKNGLVLANALSYLASWDAFNAQQNNTESRWIGSLKKKKRNWVPNSAVWLDFTASPNWLSSVSCAFAVGGHSSEEHA